MSKKHLSQDELMQKLTTPGPTLKTPQVKRLSAPMQEMGIEVTLDDVRPYDRNPRSERNPRYGDIKASIKSVGLKHPPILTQRPGDDKYMISDGGNTRLEILTELYAETGDERFYRFHAIYRPWVSEAAAMAGHLSENETRGDLSWIDKCLGVQALKGELEQQEGNTFSQRELARRAKELGFVLSHSHISRMLYTVEHFWPTLPLTLKSGMGKPQVEKLISYREATLMIWNYCAIQPEEAFSPAWHATMATFDREDQTVLPWSIVEDRLLGMLEDEMEVHLSPLDHALRTILDYRQRRWSLEQYRDDIWGPLDVELGRAEGIPKTMYPPLPEAEPAKKSNIEKPEPPTHVTGTDSESSGMTQEASDLEDHGSNALHTPQSHNTDETDNDEELDELRRQVQALEAQNASLQRQTSSAAGAGDQAPHNPMIGSDSLDDWDPAALDTDEAQQRIAAQTLSPVHESEGQRNLRDLLARQQGGGADRLCGECGTQHSADERWPGGWACVSHHGYLDGRAPVPGP
ncbi:ParB family protein [Vreelandella zhaodongensis]|uniref:ParB family protein n=1 Tax=Vreelandella zhaodongensis TaxID=1176240 RepID=UPI003EBC9D7E